MNSSGSARLGRALLVPTSWGPMEPIEAGVELSVRVRVMVRVMINMGVVTSIWLGMEINSLLQSHFAQFFKYSPTLLYSYLLHPSLDLSASSPVLSSLSMKISYRVLEGTWHAELAEGMRQSRQPEQRNNLILPLSPLGILQACSQSSP